MNGFCGAIASLFGRFSDWLFGERWSRKNKSLMRQTNKGAQRGCFHSTSQQPGRKYAKGASGSIGRGINPKFSKSLYCRGIAQ